MLAGFIIGIILFIIIFALIRHKLATEINILIFIVMPIVLAVFTISCGAVLSQLIQPKYEISEEKQIKSLTLDNQINGHFILGSGSIDEEQYYYCYEQLDNNGYSLIKYPVNNSTIFEINNDNGYILIYQPELLWTIFISGGINEDYNKYEIYLPIGSIVQEYNPNIK